MPSAADLEAYDALLQIVREQCGETQKLKYSGMDKTTAKDGTIEWVSKESVEKFIEEGSKCLVWNSPSWMEQGQPDVGGALDA